MCTRASVLKALLGKSVLCTRDGPLPHQSDEGRGGGGFGGEERPGRKKRRWVKSVDCLQMAVKMGAEVLQSL